MGQKAFTIWKNVADEIPTRDLVKIRVKLGVPEYGFKSATDHKKWVESATPTKFVALFTFQKRIASKYKKIAHGYDFAITDLILKGYVEDHILLSIDDTGCEWIVADKNMELERGIYIRIGEDTVLDDVESFVRGNSKILKEYQKKIYGSVPSRTTPKKGTKNFYRDQMIYTYMQRSPKEIREIFTKYPTKGIEFTGTMTKEIMIQKILRATKLPITSTENISQIYARMRRKEVTRNRTEKK